MYLNFKNTKFKNRFFLIIFLFVCFLFINFYKTNLVFAGKCFSKNKKNNSSEIEMKILRNSLENEMKILREQIDYLSKQKDFIFGEVEKLEKDLLLCIEKEKNIRINFSKFSKDDLINSKFKIHFLRKKKFLLQTQFHEVALEKRHLEIKLRKFSNLEKK